MQYTYQEVKSIRELNLVSWYNITRGTFFLKNHTKNVVEKLFLEPSLKIKIEPISGSTAQSFIQFVFIDCQVEDYRSILKLSCRTLAFVSYQASLNNKKRSGTSLPASFSAWCFKKNISLVIFFSLTKFYCLVVIISWDIGQYVYCIFLNTRHDSINFEINLIFLIEHFFLHRSKYYGDFFRRELVKFILTILKRNISPLKL